MTLSEILIFAALESPFYRYMDDNHDEVFCMELLIGMMAFKERFFNGVTYRSMCMNKADLNIYLWTWHHSRSFVELCTFTSTSADRLVAERFIDAGRSSEDRIGVFFILHFTERCKTVIYIGKTSSSTLSLSDYEAEQEILIIPGTFFEVTSIDQASNRTIIELKHIPV